MSKKMYTYNTISDEYIELHWKINEKPIPEDGIIKEWKKNSNLNVQISMYVDTKQLKACVAKGAKVAFYLSYHSLKKLAGTGLQGGVKLLTFEDSKEVALDEDITCIIPGEDLAGTVELVFVIALESGSNEKLTSCATQVGSILYESKIYVHLEGNQALFPVKAIDFSTPEIARPNALYYLSRKFKQLDSYFNSSYTLFFNSSHQLFKKLNTDSLNDSSNQYLLRTIMYDVYRTIVMDALDETHGLQEIHIPESDEDSFSLLSVYSRIISDLIRLYFPDKNLAEMKKMISADEESRNKLLTAVQDYILGE